MPSRDLGVEVFFVLSGFVIAYSLRNRRITGSLSWRFAVRRSLRLDPPYHFALILAAGVWAVVLTDSFEEVGERFGGLSGILANAFYLQDLIGFSSITRPRPSALRLGIPCSPGNTRGAVM